MKFLYALCAIVMLAGRAWAQEPGPQALETPVAADDSRGVRTHEVVDVIDKYVSASARPKTADKKFWVVSGLLGTAMMFDTKSTFDVLGRCARCSEGNPYVAPFLNRGPAVAVGAGLAFDVSIMVVAKHMRGSSKPQLRRTWWIVPVALTTAHVIAYQHNVSVGR